ISPPNDIQVNKSILDQIASDPNIINRSADEAAKKSKAVTVTAATTTKTAPKPKAKAIDPRTLKPGEFVLYHSGQGCDECGGSGFQGRIGIHEVLEVEETVQKMIVSHATSEDLQLAAIRNGMITMQQDGFLKAARGVTTVEEILRVTRE